MSPTLDTDGAHQPGARPPGRPPKQQDQRQRILHAAAKAIATVGFEQCSLATIANELDLSPPALYHYFPTKQSIFTEIAMTAMRGTFEAVNSAIDRTQQYAQQLEALMLGHAQYCDENYWLVNATISGYGGTTRREIERLDEFETYRTRNEELLLGILRGGIRAGEFRRADPRHTARSIYQLLNIWRWYRPDGKKRAQDFAKESFDLIFNGLRASA